mgnify:CR=1 FL=1
MLPTTPPVRHAASVPLQTDHRTELRALFLNRLLQENTQRMQVSKSMTLALLDYHVGRMRVSGQHEQVIVVREGGKVELRDTLELGFPLGLVALFIGIFAGGLAAVALLVMRMKGRKDVVPYGTFLAIGPIITLLWGVPILDWYRGLF